MGTVLKGKIVKVLGNDIDTDVIIPGKYLTLTKPEELGKHALEPLIPGFCKLVKPGADILVAGRNFGCGSSREHAVLALKGAGIRAVIAESFARIFYRNAINNGLWVIECPNIVNKVKEGDEVIINLTEGWIQLPTSEKLPIKPVPEEILKIVKAGGLIPYLRKKVKM